VASKYRENPPGLHHLPDASAIIATQPVDALFR
jgi:hypothetical protein